MTEERGTLLYSEGRRYAVAVDLLLALLLFEAVRALSGLAFPSIFYVGVLIALAIQLLFGQNTGAGIYSQGLYLPASLWESLRRPAHRFVAYCDIVDIRPTRFELHGEVVKPAGLTVRARDGRALRLSSGMSKVLLHKLKAALGDRLMELYRPGPVPERPGPHLWSALERDLRASNATVVTTMLALTALFVLVGVAGFAAALWQWGVPPDAVAAGIWASAAILAFLPAYWAAERLSGILFTDWYNALVTIWLLRKEGKDQLPPDLLGLYDRRGPAVRRAARLSELVEILELDLRRSRKRAAASLGAVVVAIVVLGGSVSPVSLGLLLGFEPLDLTVGGHPALNDSYYSSAKDVNLEWVEMDPGENIEISGADVWMSHGNGGFGDADRYTTQADLYIPPGASVTFQDCRLRTDSPRARYMTGNDASEQQSTRTISAKFKLDGAASPRLVFQTRYELALGQDFGYLELSDNGGKSWLQLHTNSTTTYRTVIARGGQKGAPAFTGSSDGWSVETADLSRWQGKEVLLRFRLVSSPTVEWHRPQWAIDHIRLDSIGYVGEDTGSLWIINGWELYSGQPSVYRIRNSGSLLFENCTAERLGLQITSDDGATSILGSDLDFSSSSGYGIDLSGGAVDIRDSRLLNSSLRGTSVFGSLTNLFMKGPSYATDLFFRNDTRLSISGCRFDIQNNMEFFGTTEVRFSNTTLERGTGIEAYDNAQVSLDGPPKDSSRIRAEGTAGIHWPQGRNVTVAVSDAGGARRPGALVEVLDRLGTLHSSAIADANGTAVLAIPPEMRIVGSTTFPGVLSRTASALLALCPYTIHARAGGLDGIRKLVLNGGERVEVVAGPSPRIMLDAYHSSVGPINHSLKSTEYVNQTVFANITVVNRGNGQADGIIVNLTAYNETLDEPLATIGPFGLSGGESVRLDFPFTFNWTDGVQVDLSTPGPRYGQLANGLWFDELGATNGRVWVEGDLEYSGETLDGIYDLTMGENSSLSLEECSVHNLSSLSFRTCSTLLVDGCAFTYIDGYSTITTYSRSTGIIIRDSLIGSTTLDVQKSSPVFVMNSTLGRIDVAENSTTLRNVRLRSVDLTRGSLYAVDCDFQNQDSSYSAVDGDDSSACLVGCGIRDYHMGVVYESSGLTMYMEGCRVDNCSVAGIGNSRNHGSAAGNTLKISGSSFTGCRVGIDLDFANLPPVSIHNCAFTGNSEYGIRLYLADRVPDLSRVFLENTFSGNRRGALEALAIYRPHYTSYDNKNTMLDFSEIESFIRIRHQLPSGAMEVDYDGTFEQGSRLPLTLYKVNDDGRLLDQGYEVTVWVDGLGLCRTYVTDVLAFSQFEIWPSADLEATSVRLELAGPTLVVNATFRCFGQAVRNVKLETGLGNKVLASTSLESIDSKAPYSMFTPLGEPPGDGELWARATADKDSSPGNERASGGNFTVLRSGRREIAGPPVGSMLVAGGGELAVTGWHMQSPGELRTLAVLPGGLLQLSDCALDIGGADRIVLSGGKAALGNCEILGPTLHEPLPFVLGNGCELTLQCCTVSGAVSFRVDNSTVLLEGCTFDGGQREDSRSDEDHLTNLFRGDKDSLEIRGCTISNYTSGVILSNTNATVIGSVFHDSDYDLMAAGGRLVVNRTAFAASSCAIAARSSLVEVRECNFSHIAYAMYTVGCRLDAESNLLTESQISIAGSDRYSSLATEYSYYYRPSLRAFLPDAPPLDSGNIFARIVGNEFIYGAGVDVTMCGATIEDNDFNWTYLAVTSTGQVLDVSKNRFPSAPNLIYGEMYPYVQEWIVGLGMDDGAGHKAEHVMYATGSSPSSYYEVPDQGWIAFLEYYADATGNRTYTTATCITLAPGYADSGGYSSYYQYPLSRTTGPLEMRNQDIAVSFPLADLEFADGDIAVRDEREQGRLVVELNVRNNGTADIPPFDLALTRTERWDTDDGRDGSKDDKTVRVQGLKKGENRTLELQIPSSTRRSHKVSIWVGIVRYSSTDPGFLESNYSNEQAWANLTLANPPTTPFLPGNLWPAVAGALSVLAILAVGVYFGGRAIARRQREAAELSGRTVPSEVLRQALSARMGAKGEGPADGSGVPPAGVAVKEPERQPGPLCPECEKDRMLFEGGRLLKCPGCGYMLVPRPEKAINDEPLKEPAGKGE